MVLSASMFRKLALFVVVMVMLAAGVFAGEDVTFRLDFEDNLNASVAAGGQFPSSFEGEMEFVEGYAGKGVRLKNGAVLNYENAKNFNLPAGTVMFWFKPDWRTNGEGRIVFFWNTMLDLYRFSTSKTKALTQIRLRAGGKYVAGHVMPDLEGGKWHHIAMVWNCEKGLCLYVDGKQVFAKEMKWTPSLDSWNKTFGLHAKSRTPDPESKAGVIDEYTIYGRDLSKDEIKAAYMGAGENTTVAAAPAVESDFVALFEKSLKATYKGKGIDGLAGVRVVFEPGVSGSAGMIRRYAYDQKASLRYENIPVVSKEGTLSFYFSPDWNPGDGKLHELVNFISDAGEINLVKDEKGRLALAVSSDGVKNELAAPCPFEKGVFHHVVVNWNGSTGAVYVDGVQIASGNLSIPERFVSQKWTLWVGARSSDRFEGNPADGVFDELRIATGVVAADSFAVGANDNGAMEEVAIAVNVKKLGASLDAKTLPSDVQKSMTLYFPGSGDAGITPYATIKAGKNGEYVRAACEGGKESTLSFWARLNSDGGKRKAFFRVRGEDGATCKFIYDPAINKVNLLVKAGEQTKALDSLYNINTGEWNLYTVVCRGGNIYFYINATWQGYAAGVSPELSSVDSLGVGAEAVNVCAWNSSLDVRDQCELFNAGTGAGFKPYEVTEFEADCWSLEGADRIKSATGEKICLSGIWRLMPSDDKNLLPPEDLGVYYSNIPGRWTSEGYYSVRDAFGKTLSKLNGRALEKYFRGWYTRYIDIPADFKGERLYITSNYLGANAARIYVNNQLVQTFAHKHESSNGEVKYTLADITRFRNEPRIKLDVLIYYNEYTRRWTVGDASLLDIALEKRGQVFAKDTFIRTYVSQDKVRLQGTLVNDGKLGDKVDVVAVIKDKDGNVVKVAKPLAVELGGEAEKDFDMTFDWQAPELWTPDNPVLYTLSVNVKKGDKLLSESYGKKFGAREFVVKGGDFLLNGKKAHLFYASASDGLWGRYAQYFGSDRERIYNAIRTLKGNGYNMIGVKFQWAHGNGGLGRTPVTQKYLLEACDELGMFVNLWAPPLSKYSDRTLYREAMKSHIRTWGSHPCIAFHGTTFNTCGYSWAEQPSKVDDFDYVPARSKENRIVALESDAILKEFDDTRSCWHNCSGNLNEIYTTMHYMSFGLPLQEREDWPSKWAKTRKTAFMCSEVGFPYHGQFYDFELARGPMLVVEHAARFFGDSLYEETVDEGVTRKGFDDGWAMPDGKMKPVFLKIKSLIAKNHIRAWRGYDCPGIGIFGEETWSFARNYENHNIPVKYDNMKTWGIKPDRMHIEHGIKYLDKPSEYYYKLKEYLAPVYVSIAGSAENFNEKDHAYWAGEQVHKQVMLINDTYKDLGASLKVELKDARGKVVKKWDMDSLVEVGRTFWMPVDFAAPDVEKRESFALCVEVFGKSGKSLGSDKFELQVFPQMTKPLAMGNKRIGIFDNKGLTRELLQKAGVTFKEVSSAADAKGLDLLIIGRQSLSAVNDSVLKNIEKQGLIEKGLDLLVFEQVECNFANLIYEETSQRYTFMKQRSHPAVKGLEGEDLINWRGASDLIEAFSVPDAASECSPHYPHAKWKWGNGGIVASSVIRKPQYGGYSVILDSGYDLMNSPLLEMKRGKGRIMMCQMDVTGRYGVDPVATRLSRNILEYMASAPTVKTAKVAYFGDGGDCLHLLEKGKADFDRLKTLNGIDKFDLLIVEGDSGKLGASKAKIAKFLDAGGNIFCVCAGDNPDLSWLPVRAKVESASDYHALVDGGDSVLNGLGNSDFYWRKKKKINVFSGMRKLCEPAVFAEQDCGKGKVVLCGIESQNFVPVPFTNNKKPYISPANMEIHQKAFRIINTVLCNMGVDFRIGSIFRNSRYMHNRKSANDDMIKLPLWKFAVDPQDKGVSLGWEKPGFDDSGWMDLKTLLSWEAQGVTQENKFMDYSQDSKKFRPGGEGYSPYDGYGWCRVNVRIPESWRGGKITLMFGAVDDIDWTYFNGKMIGHIGKETEKYWNAARNYDVPENLIQFGAENTIAVRILDIHGGGGLTRDPVAIKARLEPKGGDDIEGVSPYAENLSKYDFNAFHKW